MATNDDQADDQAAESPANEGMRSHWTADAGGWVANERMFDAVFAPFTAAILEAANLGSARRVLDVGCGTGSLLEATVAAGVESVGVDLSPVMVAAARGRVPSATVVEADAQESDLASLVPGDPYDRVVSRFGVMFFADPVAAFANIRAATAPGARLAFASWREAETTMFRMGLEPFLAHLDEMPPPPRVDAPGPLGLASEDKIRHVLAGSGWVDVEVEALDGVCNFSVDGSDGVEERLALILSGSAGAAIRAQLEPRLGPDGWAALLDEVRQELRSHLVDGELSFVGRTWLVTATSPG